ncbi:hypothetical protein OKW30_008046 [Paraburkholderia sp. Clong3]
MSNKLREVVVYRYQYTKRFSAVTHIEDNSDPEPVVRSSIDVLHKFTAMLTVADYRNIPQVKSGMANLTQGAIYNESHENERAARHHRPVSEPKTRYQLCTMQ